MPGSGYSAYQLVAPGGPPPVPGPPTVPAKDIIFSQDGSKLFVSTSSGEIKVFDVATHSLVATWNVSAFTAAANIGSLSVTEDGLSLLAVENTLWTGIARIYKFDIATGAVSAFNLPASTPFRDVEAINGTTAMVTGGDSTLYQLNLSTGAFTPQSGFFGPSILTESGRYTLMSNWGISPGSFALYDDVTNTITNAPFNYSNGVGWGVQAISVARGVAAIFSYYSTILISNFQFQTQTTISANGPVVGMTFSQDGQFLYYYDTSLNSIVKKETSGWTTVETILIDSAPWTNNFNTGNELIVSANGYYIAYRDSQNGDVQLVDLTQRNESFAGTAGTDTMAGGPGDDTYYVNLPADVVTENAFEGNDTVISTASSYGLTANIERLILDTGALVGQGNNEANVLIGNAVGNTLSGLEGDDLLLGNGGDDVLFGDNGNDNLNGGTGLDTMTGGPGNDVYIVDTVDDLVFENAGGGNDVVYTSGNYTLRAGIAVETLLTDAPAATSAINLSGNELANNITGNAGANILLGNGSNDALIGLAGDDNLDGGTGADVTNGGLGDDIHLVDNVDDVVLEAPGEGRDLVFASVNYILRPSVSVELLLTSNQAGTGAINLSGNEFDNIIQGNAGGNILFGDAGADVLLGFAGDDFLNGGAGIDILNGGLGDDIYFTNTVDDIVLENAGEGRDIIYSTASYILRAGVSVEFLLADPQANSAAINLTGNELDNNIQGNAGANILYGMGGNDIILGYGGDDNIDGGAGADTMIGGTGNDIYFADDAADLVTENAGEGSDMVFASTSYALPSTAAIESLLASPASGTTAIHLTGNDLANSIQGNAGQNQLQGLGGNDTLIGFAGNDALNGGLGADTMIGGTGDDIYYVDNAGDVISEIAGEGTADTLYTTISYVLPNGVDIEDIQVLTSVANLQAIDISGNDIRNSIRGNAGNNILLGMGGDDSLVGVDGNDILDGGLGNDTLAGENGADQFRFSSALGAGNIDTIVDFVPLTGDQIALAASVFTGLTVGTLASSAFVLGTAAVDADDRVIYDQSTGRLFFDADGNGAGVAVHFATLTGARNLSAGDIIVY